MMLIIGYYNEFIVFFVVIVGIFVFYIVFDIMSKMIKKQWNNYLWFILLVILMGFGVGVMYYIVMFVYYVFVSFYFDVVFFVFVLIIVISGLLVVFWIFWKWCMLVWLGFILGSSILGMYYIVMVVIEIEV